jgi:hypothetical protein
MAERGATPVAASSNWVLAHDGMPKNLANGNQSFKPTKPENLVRPEGVKPPPVRRPK